MHIVECIRKHENDYKIELFERHMIGPFESMNAAQHYMTNILIKEYEIMIIHELKKQEECDGT
jgi:hypothetical protein